MSDQRNPHNDAWRNANRALYAAGWEPWIPGYPDEDWHKAGVRATRAAALSEVLNDALLGQGVTP